VVDLLEVGHASLSHHRLLRGRVVNSSSNLDSTRFIVLQELGICRLMASLDQTVLI
jgi:hypothetical protein